ncbi:MAG TPA: MauE/DoxX family redox-associated membrane protein [Streptosporangiaceae bacterium]|jgi:hypothetical protein
MTLLTGVQDVQIPLLSAMLLGGCFAKLVQMLRAASVTAGLGPTALFPLQLRRPVALFVCVAEFCLGIGLIVTAGRLGRGSPASVVRLLTATLFIVATCALIELRNTRPDQGCGCFGELSSSPVSARTLARSALLAVAALSTVPLGPLQPPRPGLVTGTMLGVLAAELVLIAALSPELSEGLVRLGYSEPCELRRIPAERTLAALRKSSQWRKHAAVITADLPVDVWRELCWRYVVFPGRYGDRPAEVVFAVYLKPRRPLIRAAFVDAVTGEPLPWPPAAAGGGAAWPGQLAAGPPGGQPRQHSAVF